MALSNPARLTLSLRRRRRGRKASSMATPVVTVAAGGLPVVDVTATFPKLGLPVTEALNGRGTAVTKVVANGLPVTFSTVPDYPPPIPPFTPANLTGLIGWWDTSVFASMSLLGGTD